MTDEEREPKAYLTIHGHFYQPPRENPWLEAIELQDSALPYHDWNERICAECYNPNSISRIVDGNNKVLDIVNNYSLISFNFGPTLLSWLEVNAPKTYERIINADVKSIHKFGGHGNAMAQVYNHIIMPLANKRDKYTQVIWGIEDFKNRFGRMPEGLWLAEAAVDDETLEVLVDCGIKFTVLSPYQAEKVRPLSEYSAEWTDVSWGSIDPAKPYRYFIKGDSTKYIDLFFYDGSISKSVAFDHLLTDGNRFTHRLCEGISESRKYPQLVNIATDGESYGHHTRFGDMALAYVLAVKAKEAGFEITNYGQYLASHKVTDEVQIKPVSSWSCAHGVGRWKEDCGCSTGGHPGWNQRWRKPLREALDFLRDKLAEIFENEGSKYFKDVWTARNKYISVILDRSEYNVKRFLTHVLQDGLDDSSKVLAVKLLEMQRQTMLMYTSCGWFFSEISGIETVQIMKYAARAMQLAEDFNVFDLEKQFLNILERAKSNIPEYGNGRNIYEKFVKPSVIDVKQMASLWAFISIFRDFGEETTFYCYTIKKLSYKKIKKGNACFVTGKIDIKSNITTEHNELIFALLQHPDGDFHCALKQFTNMSEMNMIFDELIKSFENESVTMLIRKLDGFFGQEFYTLSDIFLEERKNILDKILDYKLSGLAKTYNDLFREAKCSIEFTKMLNIELPKEFKIIAEFTLSKQFNDIIIKNESDMNESVVQAAIEIMQEADKLGILLDKTSVNKLYSEKLTKRLYSLTKNLEIHQVEDTLSMLQLVNKLQLSPDISEAQNIYYTQIYTQIKSFIADINSKKNIELASKFASLILEIGNYLDIETSNYRNFAIFKAENISVM